MTSGFTPTLVLCHQSSLLPEACGPGACFNSRVVCLKTGNLGGFGVVFGAVKDLLDVLGQVTSPVCKLGRAASPPVVGLCKTLASGSSGPIARQDAFCPCGNHPPFTVALVSGPVSGVGKCHSEMAKVEMFHSGNTAAMFSRKPTCTFSPGRSPALAPFANSLISPNPRLSAGRSFASPPKKGKKIICCLTFPSLSIAD